MAAIIRPKGEALLYAASYGFSRDFDKFAKKNPISAGRGTLVGRTLLEGKPVHIPDVEVDPEYAWSKAQKMAGFRTMLGVPLIRDGTPIGVIVLTRSTVRPFNSSHVQLVTTFADQAVIAIENARLFDELNEIPRQQTATTEVLKIISRSTFDLQTVLDTLVEVGHAAVRR